MAFLVHSIEEADEEFLGLPPRVCETFISAFRELAASDTPIVRGPGWYVEELHPRQRVAPESLFSLHVGGLWRGAFLRDGECLVFIGFGYRVPEF